MFKQCLEHLDSTLAVSAYRQDMIDHEPQIASQTDSNLRNQKDFKGTATASRDWSDMIKRGHCFTTYAESGKKESKK